MIHGCALRGRFDALVARRTGLERGLVDVNAALSRVGEECGKVLKEVEGRRMEGKREMKRTIRAGREVVLFQVLGRIAEGISKVDEREWERWDTGLARIGIEREEELGEGQVLVDVVRDALRGVRRMTRRVEGGGN